MNPENGNLVALNANDMTPKGFIEVKRDLTDKERTDMQIRLYSPCGCGSGKKFKFCCKKEEERVK